VLRRTGPAARPDSEAGRPPRRYGSLLLLLILTYLLSAFTSGAWVNLIQIVLFVTVAILTLRASRVRQRYVRLIIGFGLLVSAVAAWLALSRISQVGSGFANIWTGLILLLTVVIIVRHVLTIGTVTVQSIYGAVSAYLILGLMFAAFYAAMYHFGGGKFFAHGHPGTTQTFQYFSFTTLTTLGYGDFTAAQSSGQGVAVIEALSDRANAEACAADDRLAALDAWVRLDPLVAQPRIALGCLDHLGQLGGPADDESVADR